MGLVLHGCTLKLRISGLTPHILSLAQNLMESPQPALDFWSLPLVDFSIRDDGNLVWVGEKTPSELWPMFAGPQDLCPYLLTQ